jgi:hypothetical protein
MDFPENLEISGRTAELVKAYLEQWRDLARGSSGMELVRFFEHIRRRVLLDNDTPEVRRWLCMVAIKACNDLADFGRTLTGAERAAAVQCGALAEMFRQIAEDEDEITVEMDVPRSAGLPVGSSCILRFNKAARTSIEPAPTTVLPEEVTFRFQLGALAKGRPSEGGYHKIAVAEGVDLIDLLTSSPSPAEYGERWTEMFDRMAWQVLFSHHIPGELRRAYSGLVVILLNSLRKFTDDAGWVFDVPVPPDTNRLLSRLFGHLADGGPADYTVYSRQGVLILKTSISHRDRAAVRHLNVDDMSIVPALRRLSESDVVSAANHAATPRSRTKARPNEPCPCGSQRKYKKCCGAH